MRQFWLLSFLSSERIQYFTFGALPLSCSCTRGGHDGPSPLCFLRSEYFLQSDRLFSKVEGAVDAGPRNAVFFYFFSEFDVQVFSFWRSDLRSGVLPPPVQSWCVARFLRRPRGDFFRGIAACSRLTLCAAPPVFFHVIPFPGPRKFVPFWFLFRCCRRCAAALFYSRGRIGASLFLKRFRVVSVDLYIS